MSQEQALMKHPSRSALLREMSMKEAAEGINFTYRAAAKSAEVHKAYRPVLIEKDYPMFRSGVEHTNPFTNETRRHTQYHFYDSEDSAKRVYQNGKEVIVAYEEIATFQSGQVAHVRDTEVGSNRIKQTQEVYSIGHVYDRDGHLVNIVSSKKPGASDIDVESRYTYGQAPDKAEISDNSISIDGRRYFVAKEQPSALSQVLIASADNPINMGIGANYGVRDVGIIAMTPNGLGRVSRSSIKEILPDYVAGKPVAM